MDAEMRNDFLRLLKGGPEEREYLYHFHETNESTRELLKGEGGIEYYEEIIEIATEAGAPLEEVRNRFIPLLDKEKLDEYVRKAVEAAIKKGGGIQKVLEGAIEAKKARIDAELEEKRQRLKEAEILFAEMEKSRKSWWKRLFS